jgi:purine-nucleoside phosphorylase
VSQTLARPEAQLAASIEAAGIGGFDALLVLGSGLGAFGDNLEDARAVGFDKLAGMPRSAVPGHAGRFVRGKVGSAEVLIQQGRVHLYEGWSAEEATRSVRAAALVGARVLLLTNAAGGLRTEWPVPSLMQLDDHLNLTGRTPLRPGEGGLGSPYCPRLAAALQEAAKATGVDLHTGTYAGLLGPTYETPAEIRHLDSIGADAVGMSTVCEALAGHAAGMSVAAISCITNPAAGIATGPLNHEEVVEAGAAIAADFERLLRHAVPSF